MILPKQGGSIVGRHSKTILKINTPKTNTEEKRRKKTIRWGIKSCLSILLAATVTTTTIYSQVLYAQAEVGEARDGRISFTFQPLEKTEYELDTKGSKEETLSLLYEQGLPKTLIVTTQPEAAVPEPVIPDVPEEGTTDVSGNTPDTDVTAPDASEKTDGTEVQDPENRLGSETEGTDPSGKTDGTEARDPEKAQGSDTADTDDSDGQSSGNTENADDSNAADTDEPDGPQSFELSVTWDCDYYDEIRDFYTFTPKWDVTAYEYKGGDIPVITVTFRNISGIEVVTSEEQLKEAFQIENLLQNLPEDGSEYKIILGAISH